MKKVLITGANSYIGMAVDKWLSKDSETYHVDTLDLINPNWREHSFSDYDVIFHVAGIAHQRETKENEPLYYEVNYKLAVEVAEKAKSEGVSQFIILSSMSVYGLNVGAITKKMSPNPNTNYGKSKWLADQDIMKLQANNFLVTVLRPPMVYGKNCKGNYQLLRKLAIVSPIFPSLQNQRSMIYIDNLCDFVKLVIDKEMSGTFHPQNAEYVSTFHMVKEISKENSKKIYGIGIFNPILRVLKHRLSVFQKVFGDLTYEKDDLCDTVEFSTSIKETEKR